METRVISAQAPQALAQAAEALQRGDLVAIPTDTIYGLAANLSDPEAIQRLYDVKEREPNKAIAVLLSDPQELKQVTAEMTPMAQRLAQRFWPGPLTLVVPKHPSLPENLSLRPTVGVRMPDHPVTLALLRLTGPLAVTSANLSGAESACTAGEVLDQLGGRIPLILDGGTTPGGSASSVVDCTGDAPILLRGGPVTLEDLLQALQ